MIDDDSGGDGGSGGGGGGGDGDGDGDCDCDCDGDGDGDDDDDDEHHSVKTVICSTCRHVDYDTRSRVVRWLDYNWTERPFAAADDVILAVLPESLRAEVALQVHREPLSRVGIFHDCHPVSTSCHSFLRVNTVA